MPVLARLPALPGVSRADGMWECAVILCPAAKLSPEVGLQRKELYGQHSHRYLEERALREQ